MLIGACLQRKKSGTLWLRYKQVSLYKLYRILYHIAWGIYLVVLSEVDRSRMISNSLCHLNAISCNMCVSAVVFREDPKRQYTTRRPFLQLVVQTTNCVCEWGSVRVNEGEFVPELKRKTAIQKRYDSATGW